MFHQINIMLEWYGCLCWQLFKHNTIGFNKTIVDAQLVNIDIYIYIYIYIYM